MYKVLLAFTFIFSLFISTANGAAAAVNHRYKQKSYTYNINNSTQQQMPAAYEISQEEQQLIGYINAERTKNGLNKLIANPKLSMIAHLKAEDMLKNNYFSHVSPTYGSPWDMMKKFGIIYNMAGENIAKNANVYKAHIALMNSPGHRANILNNSYTDVGVGVAHDKYGNVIVVEMFIR
ncbi:CAP domain-containing protein [Caldanaerobius polysaccharolyticus]|uniref:CAP domain-containing protein n=1 Tax=Caldanaerobius polysaccharolyticus TaxID=44256 RepID=UPI00047E7483|nr:CAP domain-containing protein [Caldanaerobius polysaccharolyticus]